MVEVPLKKHSEDAVNRENIPSPGSALVLVALPCTLGQALETGSNTGYESPRHLGGCKAPAVQDEPAAYQLVGEVTAHQGDDG